MFKLLKGKKHNVWLYLAAASVAMLHIVPLAIKSSPKNRLICSGKEMVCAANDMINDWKKKACTRAKSLFKK